MRTRSLTAKRCEFALELRSKLYKRTVPRPAIVEVESIAASHEVTTKRKIYFLAILACAQVAAFIWYRAESDHLLIRVLNSRTREPVTNLVIKILTFRTVPILSSFKNLPRSMRQAITTNTLELADGTFRLPRISRTSRVSLVSGIFQSGEFYPFGFTYSRWGFLPMSGGDAPTKLWSEHGKITEGGEDGSRTIAIDPRPHDQPWRLRP